MKKAVFLLFLCLAMTGWPVEDVPEQPAAPAQPPKPQSEVIKAKVERAFTAHDGDAEFRAYVIQWKGQDVVVSDMLALTNFQPGDEITVMVMRHTLPANLNRVNAPASLLHFQIMPERAAPAFQPQPRAVPAAGHVVMLECRDNELFVIDKDGIQAQAARALDATGVDADPKARLQALNANPIQDDNYTVDPAMLLANVVSLQPRPGVHGEALDDLDKADGKFQATIKTLKLGRDRVVIIASDETAPSLLKARKVLVTAGFNATVQPLQKDQTIKFGLEKKPKHEPFLSPP